MPNFEIECLYKGLVGGIDEAGRGPLAGPVVAAVAVFLDPPSLSSFLRENIRDSKKIWSKKREFLYQELLNLETFSYGIGSASVEEIEALNISNATFLAMQRAVEGLSQKPKTLLVDGKYTPSFKGITAFPVINGDNLSLSIAAASILAKVRRDKIMAELAQDYPLYGWEENAGYGTPFHQEALRVYGITPHHRKSFCPVKKQLTLL